MTELTGSLGVRNEINVDIIGTGARGKEGKSAYESWLDLGNEGTEQEYLASLKGDKGDTGEQGEQGKSFEYIWNGTQLGIRVEGDVSYTYVELKGDAGVQGVQGVQGIQGDAGDTGAKGDTGAQGETGNGITSIVLTAGNHAAGTTDTYTITFTSGATTTFGVYNGANGVTIVNDLTTGGTTNALSAEQGKALSTSISELNADVDFDVTNLVTDGDFPSATGWAAISSSFSVASGIASFTATEKYGRIQQQFTASVGDKIYRAAYVKANSSLVGVGDTSTLIAAHSGSGNFERLSNVRTETLANRYVSVVDSRSSGWGEVQVKYVFSVNLTARFGAGNEPTTAEMDAILAYYPNSWFDGTVNFAANPKLLPYLLNATRNRPIMASGTYAARPTSVTFPTLYLSTDKAAGNVDRLTLNVGGTTWLQI